MRMLLELRQTSCDVNDDVVVVMVTELLSQEISFTRPVHLDSSPVQTKL